MEYLTGSARALRRALLAHRDGAKVFSGTYLTDDALLESMETPRRVLTTAGFSLAEVVLGGQTVYSYVGFVIEEQAVRPSPGETDPRYELDRRARRIDPERFPLSHAAGLQGVAEPGPDRQRRRPARDAATAQRSVARFTTDPRW